MNKKIIYFNNKKINKSDFYNKDKNIFIIDDTDVDKILVSKKNDKHNWFKYFIGYNDNGIIRPLYSFISQMTGYINKCDKNNTTMSFTIKDIHLFKKYNEIWKKNWKINENRL